MSLPVQARLTRHHPLWGALRRHGSRVRLSLGVYLSSSFYLLTLLLWAFNDHVLKNSEWAGELSGKLSDVCCVIALPLAAGGVVEFLQISSRTPARPSRIDSRHIAVVVTAATCAMVMITINTIPACAEFYRAYFGVFRWPLDAAFALMHGNGLPEITPVFLVSDPTDALTAPMAWVAIVVSRRLQTQAET